MTSPDFDEFVERATKVIPQSQLKECTSPSEVQMLLDSYFWKGSGRGDLITKHGYTINELMSNKIFVDTVMEEGGKVIIEKEQVSIEMPKVSRLPLVKPFVAKEEIKKAVKRRLVRAAQMTPLGRLITKRQRKVLIPFYRKSKQRSLGFVAAMTIQRKYGAKPVIEQFKQKTKYKLRRGFRK